MARKRSIAQLLEDANINRVFAYIFLANHDPGFPRSTAQSNEGTCDTTDSSFGESFLNFICSDGYHKQLLVIPK